jgi:hypothetical protein
MPEKNAILRPLLAPWLYKSRRALGKAAACLADVAERTWEIAPGAIEPPYQIFIKEEHLKRPCGSVVGQSIAQIIRDIRPAQHIAAPSTAFLLRKATLSCGNLYVGMHKRDLYRSAALPPKRWLSSAPVLDSVVFTGLYASSRWFGHLLHDEFPLQLLGAELGPMVSHRRRVYEDEPDWREVFGIAAPPSYERFVADELIIVEDFAQNPSKRQRYARMRNRLRHLSAGHERIYLQRTKGEARRLVNEAELLRRLEPEGFVVVDSAVGVVELLRLCTRARIVITIDGSHASPMYYLADDGARIMFMLPPQRATPTMACLATMHGLRGGMFIGELAEGDALGFRVDVEEFLACLDEFIAS